MPPTKPVYPAEFKAEAVDLYKQGDRSLKDVAEGLGVSTNSLREWVRRSEQTEARPMHPNESEQDELKRLRKENRILKEEREILKKATTFFAKENSRNH